MNAARGGRTRLIEFLVALAIALAGSVSIVHGPAGAPVPLPSDAPHGLGAGLELPAAIGAPPPEEPPVALAGSFTWSGMPAVLNQGTTPECVAFSSSALKGWQDRRDQGAYFNFNEDLFFSQIGGTSAGAYESVAMQHM